MDPEGIFIPFKFRVSMAMEMVPMGLCPRLHHQRKIAQKWGLIEGIM
jgi:hypothetical protein